MIHSDRVFKSREEIVSFMAQILHVGQLLSSVNLYPDVWLVMFMLLYTTLVKVSFNIFSVNPIATIHLFFFFFSISFLI